MRGDPVRTRESVYDRGAPAGYLTTVGYPDRDLSAFAEGTPHFEIVVADLHERHVALAQRFKAHWLVRCGRAYAATEVGGELAPDRVRELAALALALRGAPPAARAERLKEHIETALRAPLG